MKLKLTLVYLLIGGVYLSPAQDLPQGLGRSVNVQRLFKFSGTLDARRQFAGGATTLHLAMYNQPDGGAAYWQETQIVHPDTQGRYTVLLGETALGGLPAEIFVPRGAHWLEVEASGQLEQPRILLVELPTTLKSDPIGSDPSVSENATPNRTTDRYIALILAIMFLAGAWITYREVRKEWEAQTEVDGEPPFPNLLRFIPSRDGLRRATQAVSSPLSGRLRALRKRLPQSVQTVADDRPNKAA